MRGENALIGAMGVALFAASALAGTTQIARLEVMRGKVQVQRQAGSTWIAIESKTEVRQGDKIRTYDNSGAMLFLEDGSTLEITPWSMLHVDFYEKEKYHFKLGMGSLRAVVRRVLARRFQVNSPVAVCAVRGTKFDVAVDPDQEYKTRVGVKEGQVGVADKFGKELMLAQGDSVEVTQEGMGAVMHTAKKEDSPWRVGFWQAFAGAVVAGALVVLLL